MPLLKKKVLLCLLLLRIANNALLLRTNLKRNMSYVSVYNATFKKRIVIDVSGFFKKTLKLFCSFVELGN